MSRRIPRKSISAGTVHYREIDVTQHQLVRWLIGRELIQTVMPHISAADREFLMTGITPEEWQQHITKPIEDEEE